MVYSPQTSNKHSAQVQKKKNKGSVFPLLWVLLPVIFIVGLSTGYLIWGQEKDTPSQESNESVARYDVSVDDDPSLGPANAPVTIIMFSDYQCGYCKKWYQEVFQPLMQNYSGSIRFVYRDFPLYSIHPSAGSTAEAADCAGDQDKYWEFFTAVFNDSGQLDSLAIQNYGQSIGLEMEEFNQCLSSRKYQSEVEKDYSYAAALGIQSTPTFFINGIALIGAQPYQVFATVIEQELSR